MPILEIAANNLESAVAAYHGGAHRIELVSNLLEGGTTPSLGTAMVCVQQLPIPVFPIIRPRGGNFTYTFAEVQSMIADIDAFVSVGCQGIVIGALLENGSVDEDVCGELIAAAQGVAVTFHRAFDRALNHEQAMETIIQLGCQRVLTSGGFLHVEEGIANITQWQKIYGEHIIIMPGAGVTAANAKQILDATGCAEIHSSCKEQMITTPTYTTAFVKETFGVTNQQLVADIIKTF